MEIHIYHHLDYAGSVPAQLTEIRTLLQRLLTQGHQMQTELATLTQKVTETTTVEQSAIELLNGLSAQIAGLKTDPAALQALADQLAAKSSELAAAIVANQLPVAAEPPPA